MTVKRALHILVLEPIPAAEQRRTMSDPIEPPTTVRAATASRVLLVIAAALVGAAVFGVTAWLIGVRDHDASTVGLAVAVFAVVWPALMGGALGAALSWIFLIGRHSPKTRLTNSRDSIERSQSERARSGAFTDVILVAAGALILVSLLRVEASAPLALSLVLAVGLLDFSVRYWVLQGRES
ncbi:hypothetical protein ET445_00785 [Agromyces protaetiae]|uniref:Uncharacterized protein n=1 Tax=Agromyces protaetiae TaxID=2509455 RepID=A0A4P6FAV2_9MICO|nr:hypothetical protein [Agromyces protaetiae]QAY72083.1 hypothetical protein ET445_00785 [Agromyces protaetiae]